MMKSNKQDLIKRWKDEAGQKVMQRLNDFFFMLQNVGHGLGSAEILQIIKDMPFREEVPEGKDLRGVILFGGVNGIDFSNWDFSFAQLSFNFVKCNLNNTIFDGVKGGGNVFSGSLINSSFKNAKLPKAYFASLIATGCSFDGAMLKGANFEHAFLKGSSFFKADCTGVKLLGANILECNFREAILNQVVLQDAIIDKSTDFRGASIIDAFTSDYFDKSGQLVAKGVDWRNGNFDATTKYSL